jgi:hypothetical protein
MGSAEEQISVIVLSRSLDFDPRLEIRDPEGTVIVDTFCSGNGLQGQRFRCSISQDMSLALSGVYLFSPLDTASNEIGGYEISIECLFGPCLFSP